MSVVRPVFTEEGTSATRSNVAAAKQLAKKIRCFCNWFSAEGSEQEWKPLSTLLPSVLRSSLMSFVEVV